MASAEANGHIIVGRIKRPWVCSLSRPKRDADQKELIWTDMNQRCVRKNSQLSQIWMYAVGPAAKKSLITALTLSSVKDALLWKAIICVQLKMHQQNRKYMSLICNRCLTCNRSERQRQCRLPLGVTQLNTKTPPAPTQELPSATSKPPLESPSFCVPTHPMGKKARDTPSSGAGMPLLPKLIRLWLD